MTSTNDQETEHRLPRSVSPVRYELRLAPDLVAATFAGRARIEVEVHEPVGEIVCNAAELEISSARLLGTAGDLPAGISLDEREQRATFSFPAPVAPGRYHLDVSFTGILNDQLRGFYRSTFVDGDGNDQVIATTQFEAADARRAFPCWDEPDRKAVFGITLDVPDGMTAVSNWPETSSEDLGDGRRRVTFADSIPMSTYIVAFVVGKLEATDPVDVDGIALRVVHPPGKGHLTAFPLDVAAHSIRFYVDWFGLPYPGPKLDLLAIPDFAAGAMENLGAVTFREAELLIDPANASQSERERVAEVIEHEIAHMWFGDLVTMQWWNGIWLNEAFATFMSILCLDDYRPDWRPWDSFARSRGMALQIDALHSTRPIEFPVHRPEDAEAMFDLLTYEKGASVLRMVERYLGAQRFRDGVRGYLAAHLYGNTETTDLWDALEHAAEEPIRALMDSWILQGGYPLVEVTATEDGVHLAHEPFALLHSGSPTPGAPPSGIGRDWLVPLIVARRGAEAPSRTGTAPEDEPGATRLILASSGASPAIGSGDDALMVANVGGHGFYRVRYGTELFGRLLGGLDRLEPLERYCLLSDTWTCGHCGAAPLEDFLVLVGHLRDETDASVWSVVIGALAVLDRAVADADRPLLQGFARSVLGPQLERVGWETVDGEDPQTPTLRAALIESLGTVGVDEGVRSECRARFAAAKIEGRAPLDAGIAQAVLSVVAHVGGTEEFEAILDGYRRPLDPQDEQRHLDALAEVSDPTLAARVHDLCLGEVRSQDAPYLLARMFFNRHVRAVTWRFVSSHWDEIVARYPRNSLTRLLRGIVALDEVDDAGDAALADEARRFVDEHPLEGLEKPIAQHLEVLEVNLAFIRRDRDRLGKLLERA